MNIDFKILTFGGVVAQHGELIERDGFQYALHTYNGRYEATELSTGLSVISVDENADAIDGISARDYLIRQIEKYPLLGELINQAKSELKEGGLPYPLNPRY